MEDEGQNRTRNTSLLRRKVILPRNNRVTSLLIDFYHRVGHHCLDHRALHEFRRKYVTLQARTTLNKAIRSCARCALFRAKPVAPEMAALPQCRVSAWQRPFTYTGVDVFGPTTVTIGRRKEKRWGIIFTCLSTRAVYLDIVASLSATSCMMAMDGLAARRGAVAQYHSDNGTNFVAAARKYRDPSGRKPTWIFNAPHAPHTGGAWERMIGVTKKVLTRMGLEEEPTEERLRWLLSRAEYLINSRPLTNDGSTMTPNDLLIGPASERKMDDKATPANIEDFLSDREKWVQAFWQWWTSAYLPTVSVRRKWLKKTENLAVGDVVFLCDDDYRYGWRKGRITEAQLDQESGQVRRVVVRTADGSLYKRHACKVAIIVKEEPEASGKGECRI